MEKTITKLGEIKSKNKNFINIKKIIVPNKVSFGKKEFKYFIVYKDGRKMYMYVCLYRKMCMYACLYLYVCMYYYVYFSKK